MGGTINHPQWLTIKRSYKRPISHGWCWRPLRRWHQHLDSSGGSVESRVALLAKGNQQRFTRCPCWVMGCKPNRKRFHQQVFFSPFFRFFKGLYHVVSTCKKSAFWMVFITSSTGGSFKDRKPIAEVGCCESRMAERTHWWIEKWLDCCAIYLSFSLSIYPSVFLSIQLSIYLSFYLSFYLSVYLSVYSIYLSLYLSICLFIYLSIYLSFYLVTYLSIYLSISLSVYLPTCLSVYLSTCLSAYLSICLSVCLSICLSIYLSIYRSIDRSICLSSICLSVYLSIYLSNYLSIDLPVCLSIYLSIYLPIYLSIFLSWLTHVMLITWKSYSGFLGANSGFLGANSMFFHGSGTKVLWK